MDDNGPVNAYEQLRLAVKAGVIPRERAVYLSWLAAASSRDVLGRRCDVISPFFKTDPDPNGPWYAYGNKTFGGGRMKESIAEAKAWAAERYGITEWKRNRLGQYVPAEVHTRFPLRRDS